MSLLNLIGKYKAEEIGQGAFGTVLKVIDEKNSKEYNCKIINIKDLEDIDILLNLEQKI